MFNERDFDIIDTTFPPNGMNQFIAPEMLGNRFCYWLENMIPDPAGRGRIRYGTHKISEFDNYFGKDPQIIEAFPFSKSPTEKQILLYVTYMENGESFLNLRILESNKIRIGYTDPIALPKVGEEIQVTYEINDRTITSVVKIVSEEFKDDVGEIHYVEYVIDSNYFPDDLEDFYIGINYVRAFRSSIPTNFSFTFNYNEFDLTSINAQSVIGPYPAIKIIINGDNYILNNINVDRPTPNRILISYPDSLPAFDTNNGDIVEIFYKSSTPKLLSVSFKKAAILKYDFSTDDFTVLKENLAASVVPRSATFMDHLLITNGVDRMVQWNGTTLEDVYDFVKELAQSFNRIDGTHFSFVVDPIIFDIEKYQNNATIRLDIYNEQKSLLSSLTTTVVSVSILGNIVTIETAENLPEFTGENFVEVFYKDYPPPFNYLFVHNNRIFALGPGAVSLEYRQPLERMRVYYQYRQSSLQDWFDETTKKVPSIDAATRGTIPDNLEAITTDEQYIVFLGRQTSQLWLIQTDVNVQGSAQFIKEMPIGIFHGNLLGRFPNDNYVLPENGIIDALSSLNVAKQLAASPITAVAPILKDFINQCTLNDATYRSCRAFHYPGGKMFGLKVGFNKSLVCLYDQQAYAWFAFSGDFRDASCFLSDLDSSLYLFSGNKIYRYADGTYMPPSYRDRGGERPINFLMVKPFLNLKKRFFNKYYEMRTEYTSQYANDARNNVRIGIYGDLRKTFTLGDEYSFETRGDLFEVAPLATFRFEKPFNFKINRLKFTSYEFWATISGQVFDGPFFFDHLRLFGTGER